MCGIAGYNVTPEWASKYIDEEKMEQILQEAWFHNIHRGWDAAGYFAVERETDKLTVFKQPGVASEIFKEKFIGKNKVPVSRVFGAHTRDPSRSKNATANSNANNHPLYWDGVWVAHNGTLINDDQIKAVYEATTDKFIPDVDSVAIPMVLSEFDGDPEDHVDDIAAALGFLDGSFAIHAIWQDYPGLSLFARSKGKPLILAIHSVGAVVYGSEEDSVWSQIHRMGLDPNDKDWKWADLKDHNMIMVKNGKPVHWGNFSRFRPDEQKPITERQLPFLDDTVTIYSTKSEYDFANRAPYRSALDVENEKDYELVHDLTDRMYLANHYPVNSDTTWDAVFSEADRVYKIKDKYHAFFGNVEIVASASRSVYDVYNHNKFDNGDRWLNVAPSDARLIGDRIPFEQFLHFQSKEPTAIPVKQEQYWFEVELERAAIKQYPFIGSEQYYGVGYDIPLPGQSDDVLSDEELQAQRELSNRERNWDEYNYIAPTMNVGWEEVYTDLHKHAEDNTLAFLYEAECPKHEGQMFDNHFDPHDCDILLNSAAFTLCCFYDVGAYQGLTKELNVEWDMKTNYCGQTKSGTRGCNWQAAEYIEIFFKTSRFEMITEQICLECFSRRKLTVLPNWFRFIDHTGRIPISLDRLEFDKDSEEYAS